MLHTLNLYNVYVKVYLNKTGEKRYILSLNFLNKNSVGSIIATCKQEA